MESFFIMALPNGISHRKVQSGVNYYEGNSEIHVGELCPLLNTIGLTDIFQADDFVYQYKSRYLLKANIKEDRVCSINIESCLWYLSNDMSNIIKIIESFSSAGWRVFHPAISYYNNLPADYVDKIASFYKRKTEELTVKYHSVFEKGDILPGEHFYKMIGAK